MAAAQPEDPDHAAAALLAQGHLSELAAVLATAEVSLLSDLLRRLCLEVRLVGPRPLWAATEAAVGEARVGAAAVGSVAPTSGAEPPAGLALEEREGMGRVLVATRDFGAGEPLFAERPLAAIPGCMGEGVDRRGPIMSRLAEQKAKYMVHLDMDVLCEFFQTCGREDLDKLSSLETHLGRSDYLAGSLADSVAAMAVELGALRDVGRKEDLLRFLRVVCVNAHTVPRIKGVMLFFWLSMFSHSCSPNATYSTDQSSSVADGDITATPRALRKIKAGEIISMSYLSLQMLLASTEARREVLRIQKGFLCGCERCSGSDDARALPCPLCGGPGVQALSEASSSGWRCRDCGGVFAPDAALIGKEDQLIRFILTFDHEDDEQTVQSLLAVTSQDLGWGKERESEHFLRAWLLLALTQLLLRRCASERRNGDLSGRSAARAAAVLWKLQAWVQERLPCCAYLLALECVVPTVSALLASEPRRGAEAAGLAAVFEVPLAAAMGADHPDVRLLGEAKLKTLAGREARTVLCDTCGASLLDGPRQASLASGGAAPEAGAAQAGGTEKTTVALWCSRCRLAPFCSVECEAAGRRPGGGHAALCVTSEGLEQG